MDEHPWLQLAELVSWSLTFLFSTNMAISESKGQGWRVILTQWRKASDILTSTLATLDFLQLLYSPDAITASNHGNALSFSSSTV